jgi:putative PEP-CTERM system TPR-repeat lipoprotein
MRKSVLAALGLTTLAIAAGAYYALHGSDPLARARILMDQGDMRGAELYLRAAIAKKPEDADTLYRLGIVDLALSNPVAGERELRHARDRGYDPVAIILPLGQAFMEQRRYDDALQEFTLPRAPKGGEADTLTIRAQAFLAQRDVDSAEQTIRDAQAIDPDGTQVLLTAARVAVARNDVDTAERDGKRLLQNDPHSLDAQLVMADVALRRGDAILAQKLAQAVIDANPRRLDGRLAVTKALMAQEKLTEAKEALDLVLQGSPLDIAANFLKTVLAVRLHDYRAADNALNIISPVLGDLPRGFYFLALAKLGVGQPAQASEAAAKYLAQMPDDPLAIKLMAFVDLADGRPDPALALLQATAAAGHADAEMYDLMGRGQAMKGQRKDAVTSLNKAVQLAPQNTDILNRLAAATLDNGDIASAEGIWKKSLGIAPDQAVATEALVTAALARGDAVAARAAIDKLRRVVGDTIATGLLEGNVQLAAFDFAAARQTFAELLRRYPDSRQVKLSLVRAQTMLGNPESAENILRGMIAAHPDDEEALNILLPVLFTQKRNDEALQYAEAARASAPTRLSLVSLLAATYVRAGQPERAVTLLDRNGANTNPELGFLRGNALLAANKRDDARKAFAAVLEQNPGDMRAVRAQLLLLAQSHDFDKARAMVTESLVARAGDTFLLGAKVGIDVRDRGIKAGLDTANQLMQDPVNMPAARELPGDAWLSIGELDKAANAYIEQFKQEPTPGLMNKAASTLANAGRIKDALDFMTAWLATHPNDADAHMVLSSVYIMQKQLDPAEQQLNAALALRPNDGTALNNLAWLVAQKGDLARGRAIAQRAYFLAPSAEIADTLGWIALRQGDVVDSLPLLRVAAESLIKPATQYHYAMALSAAGKNDEAIALLKKALDYFKTFDDRPAAEALLARLSK